MKRDRIGGFTLIELMITVAVIAILAMVAVPSYRNYIVRTQRTDATAALLRLAAAQEKWYLQNNSYTSTVADVGGALSERGWYDISVTAANTTGFNAQATPKAGGPQASDSHCAIFTITQAGKRDSTNSDCWR